MSMGITFNKVRAGILNRGWTHWGSPSPTPIFSDSRVLGWGGHRESLTGFSHICSSESLSITPYSLKAVSWKPAPSVGMEGATHTSRTGKGVRRLSNCSAPALWSKVVTPSQRPPPAIHHQKHNPQKKYWLIGCRENWEFTFFKRHF